MTRPTRSLLQAPFAHAPRTLLILGLALLCVLVAGNLLAPAGRGIVKITGIDTVAYYGNARSMLYDGDFDLRNEFAQLKPFPSRWNATVPATGLPSAPFPIGFSVIQLPFMALGGLVERLVYGQATGYTPISQHAWFLGVISFTIAGLLLTLSLLRQLGAALNLPARDTRLWSGAITLALWPATSLGFYSLSPVPHAASFFLVSAMLWCWLRARRRQEVGPWITFGVVSGLMMLCRWQDLLLMAIPASWELIALIRRRDMPRDRGYWAVRALAALVAAGVLMLQTLQWHQVYGTWFTLPQGDGFIQWPPPYAWKVLLSSQHGWLTWTPLVAIGAAGGCIALWRWPQAALAGWLGVALEVTLIGAVSTWHGDHAFGMRYLSSLTPLVATGVMVVVATLHGPAGRRLLGGLMVLCATFTLLFAVQYRLGSIPENAQLTWQEFFAEKLDIRPGRARAATAQEATRLMDSGQAAEACQLVERAATRWGDSMLLLYASLMAAELMPDGPPRDACKAANVTRQAQLSPRLMY